MWQTRGVRPPLALLGLILACESAPPPQGSAPDASDESRADRPAIDRGFVLSTPAVPLATSLTAPSQDPPAGAPTEAPTEAPADAPADAPTEAPPAAGAAPPGLELSSPEALDAEVQRRLPEHRMACARVKRLPCKHIGDLDGDGGKDIVVLVEPTNSRALGLAILWAHGGADLLGAGRRGQRWIVQNDGKSERELIPFDLSFMARWGVWAADGDAGARRGFIDPRKRHAKTFRAPSVRGDGILIDGGDSASVAYHDGKSWRLQYLGY